MQPLGQKKITQPLGTKKFTQPLRTNKKKSHNLLGQKNLANSWDKKMKESLGTKKSCNLSEQKKITQPLRPKPDLQKAGFTGSAEPIFF